MNARIQAKRDRREPVAVVDREVALAASAGLADLVVPVA